jgi:hypothetical protein
MTQDKFLGQEKIYVEIQQTKDDGSLSPKKDVLTQF